MSIGTTTAGSAVSAGPAPARKRTRGWRGPLFIAAFVAPALIVYVTLVLLPVALAAVYSFFNWNGLGALERFIGFDNYIALLYDATFWIVVRNVLVFAGVSVAFKLVIGTAVALALNESMPARGLIRSIMILPWALPTLVAVLIWMWMYSDVGGVFNSILMGSKLRMK